MTAANGVAADFSGHVYVAGSTSGTFGGAFAPLPPHAFVSKYNQGGAQVWTRQFSSVTPSQALGIAVDVTGVYVVGAVAGTLPDQVSVGGQDAFIRKYDPDGNELWTHQFGATGTDQAHAVSVDPTGVYVAGFITSLQAQPPLSDAFLRKYDFDGTLVWDRQFGSVGTDRARAVVASASGVFVVGTAGAALPGQTSAGGTDAFIRKYGPDGSEFWTRQFGTPSASDQALAVSADGSGVYVAGTTPQALPGQASGGAFVRKYDFDGADVWTQQFGAGSDQATTVTVDASGVHVAGVVGGSLPGQLSAGQSDAFVRTYDTNGFELWTRQFGTAGADRALGIVASTIGVYVTGMVAGVLPDQAGVGLPDAFLRRYDGLSGNEVWTRQFGTLAPQGESATSVDVSSGHVYVAGDFGQGVVLQSIAAEPTVGGAFLQKYDLSGNEIWTRRITTGVLAPPLQGAFGVGTDASGVYVAGVIAGSLPGQQSTALTSAFIRKYDSDGQELWTRQLGTVLSRAQALAVGGSAVYVVGTITLGALPGEVSAGGPDAFIRKYAVDGTEIWTRQFGTVGSDQASGVSVDESGVYVAGLVGGALPNQVSGGGSDAFLRKYGHDGVESWTVQFGTAGADAALAVASDPAGAYVIGSFGQPGPAQGRTFVRRYSPDGSEVWTDQFGGPEVLARDVSVGAGGIYVGGRVTEFTDLGPIGEGFVRKYDPSGVLQWSELIGAFPGASSSIVALSADSTGPYIAGSVGSLTMPPSAFVARLVDDRAVTIDIKPGAFPNTISLGSRGIVQVAILSAPDFDATTVDPATVTLAGAAVRDRGNGTPMADLEDVNADGYPDLVVNIAIEGLQLSETDSEAVLTGRTFVGERIQGVDTVRTVP